MKVLKESGSIEQEISSRAKVELRIWISLVLLERQHTVSTMDVEKNWSFLRVLREKVKNLAEERQITRLKSQHLLPTVQKISRAPPYLPEFHWSVHSARDHIHTKREVLDVQLERMYNEEFGDMNGTLEEGMQLNTVKPM